MFTIDISGASYLYILESNGLHKIGFSKDPWTRRRRLQTGSPTPIKLIHTLQTPFFAEMEEELHRKFRKKRVHGEWFALEDADLHYARTLDFRGFTPDEVAQALHEQRARDGLEPWTAEENAKFDAAVARIESIFPNNLLPDRG